MTWTNLIDQVEGASVRGFVAAAVAVVVTWVTRGLTVGRRIDAFKKEYNQKEAEKAEARRLETADIKDRLTRVEERLAAQDRRDEQISDDIRAIHTALIPQKLEQ